MTALLIWLLALGCVHFMTEADARVVVGAALFGAPVLAIALLAA
jgi:hypothetical protein